MARLMCRAGAQSPCEMAGADLKAYGGIDVEGRPGKQEDDSSKTREAKLGCVFTQHHVNEEGCALRDESSTSYIASFESSGEFGTQMRQEAIIGSGVVEAGCKTVIGKRLKQSGMFWSTPGARNVLSLRCALHGNRFDSFWNQRTPSPPSDLALANQSLPCQEKSCGNF